MLALEAKEPNKYRSWRDWTKYDAETGQYPDVILRDNSHAFLAPEGKYGDAPAPSTATATAPESVSGGDLQPNQTVADATPKKEKPMFDLFSMLGGSGLDMGALGKGLQGLPVTPSAADGADTLGNVNPYGKLGMLAQGMGGGGMTDKEAAGQPLQPAQFNYKQPTFDISKLQAMLQQMNQLGSGTRRA